MRLLHVIPTYLPAVRYGGPIQTVHALCRALAGHGHDVHVYTTSVDGPHDSDVPLGQPVDLDGVKITYFRSAMLRRLYWSPPLGRALEAGVPGFEVMGWYGVFGPAKLPKEVTTRLSNEMVKVARRPDIVAKLNGAGAEPIGSSTEEFSAFVAADYEKWLKVIKTANIKAE